MAPIGGEKLANRIIEGRKSSEASKTSNDGKMSAKPTPHTNINKHKK